MREMFGYPLAISLLTIASIALVYNLTDARFVEITAELDKRKSAPARG